MGSSWVGMDRAIPQDKQTIWVGLSYGFWADDVALYIWLKALGSVIDDIGDAPDWLRALRASWIDIPTGGGCVFTSLNSYLTDDDRPDVLLRYAVEALQRLLNAKGNACEAFDAVRQISEPGIELDVALGARVGMIELAAQFIRLLQGQVQTGEHILPALGYLAVRP